MEVAFQHGDHGTQWETGKGAEMLNRQIKSKILVVDDEESIDRDKRTVNDEV
jgi:hypothetical protein